MARMIADEFPRGFYAKVAKFAKQSPGAGFLYAVLAILGVSPPRLWWCGHELSGSS
jgi:hypothetical protein